MRLLDVIRTRLDRRKALRRQTQFGTALIYDTRWHDARMRILEVGGVYQSATFLDDRWCYPPFPYMRLYDNVFKAGRTIRSICMLGGGGYAYPKHVIAHHPPTCIDVVEIDPEITALAQEFFFLDRLEAVYHARRDGRLGLVCADALAYLTQCAREGKRYDALLNDCFAGSVADDALAGEEAAQLVHRCLTPSGFYLTNVITALDGPRSSPLWECVRILGRSFSHILACPAQSRDPHEMHNVMVIASDSYPDIPGALHIMDTTTPERP